MMKIVKQPFLGQASEGKTLLSPKLSPKNSLNVFASALGSVVSLVPLKAIKVRNRTAVAIAQPTSTQPYGAVLRKSLSPGSYNAEEPKPTVKNLPMFPMISFDFFPKVPESRLQKLLLDAMVSEPLKQKLMNDAPQPILSSLPHFLKNIAQQVFRIRVKSLNVKRHKITTPILALADTINLSPAAKSMMNAKPH